MFFTLRQMVLPHDIAVKTLLWKLYFVSWRTVVVLVCSRAASRSRTGLNMVLQEALRNISLSRWQPLVLFVSSGIWPELPTCTACAHRHIVDFSVAVLWRWQNTKECTLERRVGVGGIRRIICVWVYNESQWRTLEVSSKRYCLCDFACPFKMAAN